MDSFLKSELISAFSFSFLHLSLSALALFSCLCENFYVRILKDAWRWKWAEVYAAFIVDLSFVDYGIRPNISTFSIPI